MPLHILGSGQLPCQNLLSPGCSCQCCHRQPPGYYMPLHISGPAQWPYHMHKLHHCNCPTYETSNLFQTIQQQLDPLCFQYMPLCLSVSFPPLPSKVLAAAVHSPLTALPSAALLPPTPSSSDGLCA